MNGLAVREVGTMSEGDTDGARYPWAGPALFAAVAVALLVFFWWFLSAG